MLASSDNGYFEAVKKKFIIVKENSLNYEIYNFKFYLHGFHLHRFLKNQM